MTLSEVRTLRADDPALGTEIAQQRSARMDGALLGIAREAWGDDPPFAAVAVGGYGRGELSPHSDIDLMFLARDERAIKNAPQASFRNILYPLWDEGFKVGHAVLTPTTAIDRGRTDVHALTALLSVRLIAGSVTLSEELLDRRARLIRRDRKKLVRQVLRSIEERHALAASAGWSLAPDLKNDIGGLRDIAGVAWLSALDEERPEPAAMEDAKGLFLAAREILHTLEGRAQDQLRMDLQPKVASELGYEGPAAVDPLMSEIHSAARSVERTAWLFRHDIAGRALGGPRRAGRLRRLDRDVVLEDGELHSSAANTPTGAMWLLAEHSKSERPLHPKAVRSLDAGFQRTPDAKWADELRQAFLELLDGPGVESALRHLDHACALIQLLPEWKRVRALAQHDPYHRYTVDGHSFKAVAEVKKVIAEDPLARRAAEEAGPITTLLIAALLHDIGKGPKPAGGPADHSELGAGLAAEAARRMGCDAQEVAEIEILVRHHLSLVDTATRRDLGDGDVIRSVAENVGSPRALRLLFILTQADARATGPEAWGSWKAALVTELYRKALVAIETGHIPPRTAVAQRLRELAAYDPLAAAIAEDMAGTLPASYLESPVDVLAEELRMLKMAPPDSEILTRIEPGKETEITVCLSDRPGILARSAGVVALHRLDVLRARTYSTTTGVALQRFTVRAGSGGAPDWTVFENDLRRAFSGRLPLEAEVERKVSDYRPSEPLDVEVRALQAESAHSTVLEVRSRDALGVLYSIAQALAHLDIDIHVAKVDTLGERIVDAFYVRSIDGKKLDEDQVRSAIAAITHRIGKLFG